MRNLPTLALLSLTAACTQHPSPAAPVPALPVAPAEAPPPPPAFVGPADPVMYCVVRNGRLELVAVQVSVSGDTVYRGTPIARAFPADSTYALNAPWYREFPTIMVAGGRYLRYGQPRILGTTDVVPMAVFENVAVFAEPAANPRRPDVIYVPERPGCEFQPYIAIGVK